ncbi:phage tail protein I [Anaerotruncus sp. AF02-27]|uniref:phage tail protein I n=1 Tax=Anaerotruncus sp. AF02-27 TaxID=2292191 RepID=UPI000E47A57B|nr:phage tail protein I [Anaerotruncus sp. AF02-27]RGX53810.1 phage tail protein I [Anaerotruncus sp. AF02-27]
MMRLKDLDLLALQTAYMQRDLVTQATCYALEPLWREIDEKMVSLLIYPRISELSGEVLDELAWQYHVDGYDATASDIEKRRMILDSPTIHRYKGTVYAVEQIIAAVFGDQGKVTEWFDYGGSPYHFKVEVYCIDRGAGEADILRAEQLVNVAKNLRSILDEIRLILVGSAKIALAAASIQSETVTVYPMGSVD